MLGLVFPQPGFCVQSRAHKGAGPPAHAGGSGALRAAVHQILCPIRQDGVVAGCSWGLVGDETSRDPGLAARALFLQTRLRVFRRHGSLPEQ